MCLTYSEGHVDLSKQSLSCWAFLPQAIQTGLPSVFMVALGSECQARRRSGRQPQLWDFWVIKASKWEAGLSFSFNCSYQPVEQDPLGSCTWAGEVATPVPGQANSSLTSENWPKGGAAFQPE